jgi:hypothetical protein
VDRGCRHWSLDLFDGPKKYSSNAQIENDNCQLPFKIRRGQTANRVYSLLTSKVP